MSKLYMDCLNFRSKPMNLMPNAFEAKTPFDAPLESSTDSGQKLSPKPKVPGKPDKKEKKERKPPKAKTPEQEAKNVLWLHLVFISLSGSQYYLWSCHASQKPLCEDDPGYADCGNFDSWSKKLLDLNLEDPCCDSQAIVTDHFGWTSKPANNIMYLRLATSDDEEWSVFSWGPTLSQSWWLPSALQLPRPEAMKQAATTDIEKHLTGLEKARADLEAS